MGVDVPMSTTVGLANALMRSIVEVPCGVFVLVFELVFNTDDVVDVRSDEMGGVDDPTHAPLDPQPLWHVWYICVVQEVVW